MKTILFHWAVFGCSLLLSQQGISQSKASVHIGDDPIIIDSASTMLIPCRYESGLFSSNKTMTWGNNLANFIVYEFASDQSRKLFSDDVFIKAPAETYYRLTENKTNDYPFLTKKWVFYLVRYADYSRNGKIDDNDPVVLFVTDRQGKELHSITPANESVIDLTLYESLGFALVKIRRDKDNNRKFDGDDDDEYLIRIDLTTLHSGKPIEYQASKTN